MKMNLFLEEKGFIDIRNIKEFALSLVENTDTPLDKAKKLYYFVRDKISHSSDIEETKLTKYASEVLKYKHGICFAKSILLVTLLRANNIPAGFGYQKLILDDDLYPWLVLHGYVFIYIEEINKWIKVDARGSRRTPRAEFSIEETILEFVERTEYNEYDENINHSYPVNSVIDYFEKFDVRTLNEVPRDFE